MSACSTADHVRYRRPPELKDGIHRLYGEQVTGILPVEECDVIDYDFHVEDDGAREESEHEGTGHP